MDAEEAAIAAREEQRNILEGYLYKLRDLLDSDSQHTFVKHSQESERRAIARQLKEVSSWFNAHEDEAQTKDFVEKRSSLECVDIKTQLHSLTFFHQEIGTADCASSARNRGVPAGVEYQPDVELARTRVPHGSTRKSD